MYGGRTSSVLFGPVLPITVSNSSLVSTLNPKALDTHGETAEDQITNKDHISKAADYNSA